MTKLHIISDGTDRTTRIFTENGEDISKYVHSLIVRMDRGAANVAQIEFVNFSVDIWTKFTPSGRYAHLIQSWRDFVYHIKSRLSCKHSSSQ